MGNSANSASLTQSRCWVKDGYLYVPGVICGHECALCVCHFFPSSLNSHACQHTHKALSLTFFFFFFPLSSFGLLAQSKRVGWQLLASHVGGG